MAHTFSPSTWKEEAGRPLSLRPAWSTEQFPDSQGYTEKPCLKKKKKKKERKREEREREKDRKTERKKGKKDKEVMEIVPKTTF
jgi:hypothetical protein